MYSHTLDSYTAIKMDELVSWVIKYTSQKIFIKSSQSIMSENLNTIISPTYEYKYACNAKTHSE